MSECMTAPHTDFASAYTYLPAICMLLWVGAASSFACLFNENQYHLTPYLLVACYTVNWWTAARLPYSWNLLPRGVSTWLAWVAYSHIFHEKIKINPAPASDDGLHGSSGYFASLTVWSEPLSLLHTFAAGAVSVMATRQTPQMLPVLAISTAALTLFPTPCSSFLHLSCGPRVLKTVLFSGLYSFLYIIGPWTAEGYDRHHQAVTMGAVWVLLCTPYALIFLPFQVVCILFQRDFLSSDGVMAATQGAAASPDLEQPRTTGPIQHTTTKASTKSKEFDKDLEKALSSVTRPVWESAAPVDVSRLQQMAATK